MTGGTVRRHRPGALRRGRDEPDAVLERVELVGLTWMTGSGLFTTYDSGVPSIGLS